MKIEATVDERVYLRTLIKFDLERYDALLQRHQKPFMRRAIKGSCKRAEMLLERLEKADGIGLTKEKISPHGRRGDSRIRKTWHRFFRPLYSHKGDAVENKQP